MAPASTSVTAKDRYLWGVIGALKQVHHYARFAAGHLVIDVEGEALNGHLLFDDVAFCRLERKSEDYKTLTDGVIETEPGGGRRVRLLCNDGQCEKILYFCAGVQPQLEKSIDKVVVSNRTDPY